MIVCKSCGHENEGGDTFCGSCGAFLEWSGESVDVAGDGVGDPADYAEEVAAESAAAEAAAVEEARRAAEAARTAEEEARRRAADEARALARAREEAEARARADAESAERARVEAAAVAERGRLEKAEAQAREHAEQEARARSEAEDRAAAAMEATRRAAEAAAVAVDGERADAAESVRVRVEEQARVTAELDAARAAEDVALAEAEEQRRSGEAARQRAEQEARARADADRAAAAAAEAEAAARARAEAESRARADADVVARAEQAARAEAEAAAKAKADANRRAAALLAKPPPAQARAAVPTSRKSSGAGAPVQAGAGLPSPGATAMEAGNVVREPVAHQPAAPQRRRTATEAPKAPSRVAEPGDLICGQCGEVNGSDRRFCRRCGASLVEAVVVKTPWWRKLRRRKRVLKAGDRPRKLHRSPGRRVGGLLKKVVVGVVVATLGLAAVPRIGPVKNPVNTWAVKQKRSLQRLLKPKIVIVRPTAATASSEDPAHPAGLAIDGKRNTFWAAAAGTPNQGVGQFVVTTFDKPVLLSHIGFTIGPLGKPEDFLTQPRPAKVHVVLSNAAGASVGTKDVTLSDKAEFQRFVVVANNVSRVQIQVNEVNLSPQGGQQVSIAELEFFKKA